MRTHRPSLSQEERRSVINQIVRRTPRTEQDVVGVRNLIMERALFHDNPPNAFRYGEYTHVSDLLYKCLRMVAISYRDEVPIIGETRRDGQDITLSIGEAVHDYITDKAIRTRPEEVYGSWTCRCRYKKVHNTVAAEARKKPRCPRCRTKLTRYQEMVVFNEEYKISGSIDLTFLINKALYLTELKSMKHSKWEELTRPIPDHIIQVVFYWWLCNQLQIKIHPQVSIIYCTKDWTFKNPYKEFIINPEDYVRRLDDYLEEAKALKAARAGGTLPVKICPTIQSPQAKKCEMCTICFSK